MFTSQFEQSDFHHYDTPLTLACLPAIPASFHLTTQLILPALHLAIFRQIFSQISLPIVLHLQYHHNLQHVAAHRYHRIRRGTYEPLVSTC